MNQIMNAVRKATEEVLKQEAPHVTLQDIQITISVPVTVTAKLNLETPEKAGEDFYKAILAAQEQQREIKDLILQNFGGQAYDFAALTAAMAIINAGYRKVTA